MGGRLILALLAVFALAVPAAADELAISGQVTYREKIPLPPDPVLRVRLLDADRLDAPALVEAEGAIAAPGQVPLTFTLRFDDSLIEAGHNYATTAEITSGGALWFSSFSPHPVDPLAGAIAEPVVLAFAGRTDDAEPEPAAETPDESAESPLLNVVWRAETLGGEPLDEERETSLSIAGDLRAGGRGGCNSYFTQVWLQGSSIQFSAIAATEMACTDPAAVELEQRYFAALQATRFWRLVEEELVLLDESGSELVRFRRSAR